MQEDIENKSLTLIINTSKLTARTLASAFMKFCGTPGTRFMSTRT